MAITTEELLSLPAVEKLRIVELLWDDLGQSENVLPLTNWLQEEATRRRAEMRDPKFGLSHEQVWGRIESAHE